MQTEGIMKWSLRVLYLFIRCRWRKCWLPLHSAVVLSTELIAWIKATCPAPHNGNPGKFVFSFSSAFPIESWVNEQEEMFHVALFRRLLFLSIWNSLLAQQAGHSIRCFEPACHVVSLHFLFCLPVFPKALVALISRGPSALQTFIFSRFWSSPSSLERPKDGWCLEEREFGGHWLECWKTKWLPAQDLNTIWSCPPSFHF